MKYLSRLFGVLFTVSILTGTMHAIDTEISDDSEAVFELLKASEDQFKDHALITVFDHITTEYAETGAAVTEEEILLHYRTDASSAAMRSLHYEYNPRTALIEFVDVKIYHTEDNTVETIPLDSVFIKKAPANSIFWNFDAVVCPVPRLRDGDALYYKIKRQGLNLAYLHEISDEDFRFIPPQEGYFMDTLYFQERHPVIEKTYDISGPREKPLQFTIANGSLKTTVRFTDEQWQYTFAAENVSAWHEEPFDDGYEETALKLALASHPSWEMKSKWAYEHNEPQFIISPEIQEKTMEVIEGCDSDDCKMFRLLHWVAEEIRYLGLDMGEGEGHMVHPTDEIFNERAGVCKDKAAILVSMLRAAGFESYFVMTLAMEQTLDIPADDKFNHGVVVVRNTDGTWTFLDPTWAPQNRPLFNYSEQEQPVLIAAPEGVDLMHVPYSPPKESPFIVTAETTLNLNGSAVIEMFIDSDGFVDGRFRSMLNWMSPTYRNQFIQNFIEDLSPLAEVVEFTFSHPLDFDQPLQMKIKAVVPEAARNIGETLFLNPLLTRHLWNSRWNSRYLYADSGPEKRNHGLELACTRHVEFNETIHLPKGYSLGDTPEKIEITGDTIDATFEITKGKRNTLNVLQTIVVKRRVTPADEYPAVRKAVEKLNEIRDTLLVLESTGKPKSNPKAQKIKKEVKPHFQRMPEHGAIYHERVYELTFAPNKVVERFITDATVFNEEGRDRIADSPFIYISDSQTVEVQEAWTETPDGEKIYSPTEAINKTMASEVYGAPDFQNLGNFMVSQIGVEYGSRMKTSVIRTTNLDDTDSVSNFQSLFTPELDFPAESSSFVVKVPVNSNLYFESIRVDSEPMITTDENWKVYTWSFKDVPASYHENHQGSYFSTMPLIVVAAESSNSWEKQAVSLQAMLYPSDDEIQELLPETEELFVNCLSDRDKLQAIFTYTNENVHPVDVGSRRFLYRTRSPQRVVSTGYGYKMERIKLISSLASIAGINCSIGFGGSDTVVTDTVPSLRLLSMNSLAFDIDDKVVYKTLTGKNSGPDNWVENRFFWVSQDEYLWMSESDILPETNLIDLYLDLKLADKDAMTGKIEITWSGVLNAGSKAQKNTWKWMTRVLAGYVTEPKITTMNIRAFDTENGTTQIECEFTGKLQMDEFSGDIRKLSLSGCPNGFATDRYRLAQRKNRKHPFYLKRNGTQNEHIRITIPESLKLIDFPRSTRKESDAGTFIRLSEFKDGILSIERTVTLPELRIKPENYLDFVSLYQMLHAESGSTLYLTDVEGK